MIREQLIRNLGKEILFRVHDKFRTGKVNWVSGNYVNLSLTKSEITISINKIKEIR